MLLSSFSKTVAPGHPRRLRHPARGARWAPMETLILENYVSPVMFVAGDALRVRLAAAGSTPTSRRSRRPPRPPRRDDLGARARDAGGDALERAERRLLPLGRSPRRPQRRRACLHRPTRSGVTFIKGSDFFFTTAAGSRRSAGVLLREAGGDRRGRLPPGAARARRRRRLRRDLARLRDGPPRRARPLRGRVRHASRSVSRSASPPSASTRTARARPAASMIEEHDELGAGAGATRGALRRPRGSRALQRGRRGARRPRGTLVFVRDPATRRGAVASEADTTVLVVGGTVGKAFEPSPWESWLEAQPFYEAKEFEPRRGSCCGEPRRASRTTRTSSTTRLLRGARGQARAALEHLTRAIELDPRVRGSGPLPTRISTRSGTTRFPG